MLSIVQAPIQYNLITYFQKGPKIKMQYERKLIQIFKGFIEKALIPQIKRMQGSLFEWNKFNSMLNTQPLNYTQLQMFVDSLGQPPTSTVQPQRKWNVLDFTKKRSDDDQSPPITSPPLTSPTFNPSKTFGGDRARIMFPLKSEVDENVGSSKEWNYSTVASKNKDDLYGKASSATNINSAQGFLPGLERLGKIFSENQAKMQNFLQSGNNTPPYISEFAMNRQTY